VDDDGVARAGPDGSERVHRGRACKHQSTRLLERQGGRLRHHTRGGHDRLRRVSTLDAEGNHLVAGVHPPRGAVGVGTHRENDSGGLEPESHRQLGRISTEAAAVGPVVDRIGAGRSHVQQDFAWTGRRNRKVDQSKDLRAAERPRDHSRCHTGSNPSPAGAIPRTTGVIGARLNGGNRSTFGGS
jgi:hypothetical protein